MEKYVSGGPKYIFNSTLLLQPLFAFLIAFQAFLDFTLLVVNLLNVV